MPSFFFGACNRIRDCTGISIGIGIGIGIGRKLLYIAFALLELGLVGRTGTSIWYHCRYYLTEQDKERDV